IAELNSILNLVVVAVVTAAAMRMRGRFPEGRVTDEVGAAAGSDDEVVGDRVDAARASNRSRQLRDPCRRRPHERAVRSPPVAVPTDQAWIVPAGHEPRRIPRKRADVDEPTLACPHEPVGGAVLCEVADDEAAADLLPEAGHAGSSGVAVVPDIDHPG